METFEQIPLFNHPDLSIEVRPGAKTVPLPRAAVPRVAVGKMVPQGEGTYKFVAVVHGRYARITPDVLNELNIDVSPETIKRLVIAGFIEGGKLTPGMWSFDVQSYMDHLEAVYDDPEFWDETNLDQNLQKWQRSAGY